MVMSKVFRHPAIHPPRFPNIRLFAMQVAPTLKSDEAGAHRSRRCHLRASHMHTLRSPPAAPAHPLPLGFTLPLPAVLDVLFPSFPSPPFHPAAPYRRGSVLSFFPFLPLSLSLPHMLIISLALDYPGSVYPPHPSLTRTHARTHSTLTHTITHNHTRTHRHKDTHRDSSRVGYRHPSGSRTYEGPTAVTGNAVEGRRAGGCCQTLNATACSPRAAIPQRHLGSPHNNTLAGT